MSLEESLALRTAAAQLVGEFAGVFGAETIERFLHPSFDQSVRRARGEVVGERPVPGGTGPAGRVTHRHGPAGITRTHKRPIGERRPDPAGDAGHDDTPATVGLTARTIAPCIPGAASWVNTTSGSVKPAAVNPSRYSDLDRAPAMHPT